MSTNILNLDDLRVTKTIVLNKKERELRSMTVGEFIDASDFEEKVRQADGPEQVKLLIDRVVDFIADTEKDELMGLSLEQLFALLAFIRGTDMEEEEASGDESPKKGKK